MPEKYGSLEVSVPKEKGEAPNGPQAFKDFADSLIKPPTGAAKQLLIVQSTGAVAYKAMKGDATLAEDGTLTIGAKKVLESMLADAVVAKLSDERVPKKESVTREKLEKGLGYIKWYTPLFIEGSQTRENAAYGTLTTPDEIKEVVIPEGAILVVDYTALWENTKLNKGRAAIFIGNNQLKIGRSTAVDFVTSAAIGGSASGNVGDRLMTFQGGLLSTFGTNVYTTGSDWTTTGGASYLFNETSEAGLHLEVNGVDKELPKSAPYGGFCMIPNITAGTYNVSIRFKALEGSVSAKLRRLKVGVIG